MGKHTYIQGLKFKMASGNEVAWLMVCLKREAPGSCKAGKVDFPALLHSPFSVLVWGQGHWEKGLGILCSRLRQ